MATETLSGGNLSTVAPEQGTLRQGIIDQADRIREDCDFSSQRHFNTGAFFKVLYYAFGVVVAILGSLGGAALLAPSAISAPIGAVASLSAAGVVGVSTALSPGQASADHYRAGNDYLALRKEAIAFLDLDVRKPSESDDLLEGRVRQLRERAVSLDKTYSDLYTPKWAYRAAKENIRRGQTTHMVDSGK